MDKIDAANHVADKGMKVILIIATLSELLRNLSVDVSQERIDEIAEKSKELELSFNEYENVLLHAIQEIISDDSSDASGFRDDLGVRL